MIAFEMPIRTAPGLNAREHWATRKRRVDREHQAVAYAFPKRFRVDLPILVKLIRRAPGTRPMDDDNLPGSMKAIRDAIAKQFGVDDGRRDLIRFEYDQERGPWAVRVEIRRTT